MAWNLKELREQITLIESNPEWPLELVRSIDHSIRIFRFHVFNARDSLKGLVNEESVDSIENVKLFFGSSERQHEFATALVAGEAHLFSSFLAARSIADFVGQLVNSLVLGGALSIEECTLRKVTIELPDSDLKRELASLLRSPSFHYVADFCNVSKHRYLVQQRALLSFDEGRVGLKVSQFEYGGRTHDECWAYDALKHLIEVKNALIAILGGMLKHYPAR